MENKQNIDIKALYRDPRLIKAIDNWDILGFLDDNGISYRQNGKNIGSNFVGISPCPLCGDNKDHFGIDYKNKMGTCFNCKTYLGPLAIICKYGKMNIKDAFNFLINENEENLDIEQRIKEILKNNNYNEQKAESIKKDILPSNRRMNIKDLQNPIIKNFFNERKLYLWDIYNYDLRLSITNKFKNFIFWPIYLNNEIVSWQGRSLIKKYYYMGKNATHYLFNENEIIKNKPLILVEGFLDYTRINYIIKNYFFKKISVTTGLTKSISKKQIQRIINSKPSKLIVIFDRDSWFDYMRLKKEINFNVDFSILPRGKDPNDLNWKQLKNLFRNIL